MRTGRRIVTSLVALGLLTSACVSPRETEAVIIEDVPFDLLGPAAATTTTAAVEELGPFELTLFFLADDNTLWRVERAREQAPGLQEALDALVSGPTEEEVENLAVRARLSEGLNPVASQPVSGLLSITVSDEAQFRQDDVNNRLVTQVLVCTMTQFDSVGLVQLRDSEGTIPLSGIESESIGDTATAANYNDCEAEDLATYTLDPEETDGDPESEDEAADDPPAEDG